MGQNKDLVLGMDEGSLAELHALPQARGPAVIMIVKSPTADTGVRVQNMAGTYQCSTINSRQVGVGSI